MSRHASSDRAGPRRQRPFRPQIELLDDRLVPAAPAAPVIIEPVTSGQVVSNFDVHMEVDRAAYSDPDGHAHRSTTWVIRETRANGGAPVWVAAGITDSLSRVHIHLGDGSFVGSLGGQTALLPDHPYALEATFTDSNREVSPTSTRPFRTAPASAPVPGAGTWIVREGYRMELAATAGAFRLPVNIAFVPNPGTGPNAPLYYVSELYGSIKVVFRDGRVGTYATGLLDFNPDGPISGSGEQGLTGLAVDPGSGDLFVGMLWNAGASDDARGGSGRHFAKVERLHSGDGGRTMATRQRVFDSRPETQGASHQISNVTFGPDGMLYVHMGDGFISSTALDLNQFRGKVLRMTPGGAAPGDNPFYDAADGITARDYVFTSGHRNAFGGAWRAADGRHYVVENGNALDRLVRLDRGRSYGWAGNDAPLVSLSQYVWNPATAPVNIAFVQRQTFGGSLLPGGAQDTAFVSLSGPTYAAGPQANGKRIEQFTSLDALDGNGKLAAGPVTLVRYNGTGRASISALAAGPDGLYFSDLYRDDGAGGPTAAGANVYRLRYVDFPPGDVTAIAADERVTLTWTPRRLAAAYNVYRSAGHGDAPELVGRNITGTSFTDRTVSGGTEYHYFVRGVNAGGESTRSNEVHATPLGPPSQPPTVATAPAANPAPVTGTTTTLSVLGADDRGEPALTYTWAVQGTPPAPVTFSANGTNAGKTISATFTRAGDYTFRVTIRDAGGRTVAGTVAVTVVPTATSVVVSPARTAVAAGGTRQFGATARDQFGSALADQPAFTWNLDAGPGAVDSAGLFTAPATGSGTATVRATAGAVTGTATVAVAPRVDAVGNGLAAVYYDNINLTGTSVLRTDATVNFAFGAGSPHPLIRADTFSARWIGAVEPRFTERYTFTTTSDDGVRLWVDGRLIIDQWNDHGRTRHTGTVDLVAGFEHDIRLEYYERTGGATIQLQWESASQAREVVPRSQLYSNIPLRVNFQPAGTPTPAGYLPDTGAAFGDRGGLSYGWSGDFTGSARDRDSPRSPNQRYDTFVRLQKPGLPDAVWEAAVRNGAYRVHVVSGDPDQTDGVYRTEAEGVAVVRGRPSPDRRWVEGWADVVVTDGRLTLTSGAVAVNNRINFIEILPLGYDFGTLTELP